MTFNKGGKLQILRAFSGGKNSLWRVRKMKANPRKIITALILLAFVLLAATSLVSAKESDALKGVKSPKVIFDVRIANPQSAALHLKLIHQTYQQLVAEKKKPVCVVSFMGPSVKLISKNRQGFAAEDQKSLDEIAATVSKMAKDGLRVEICLFAAKVFGVDPASILPEIKKVENGWISVIGYQAQGYSLVPAY
jgi:intracellular sulfur oxidation DsrE/DsrF family protein